MHNQFKTQKFKHLMLAMGPRDLNSAPYSPVHCSSHSMTSFQPSELTEPPVVENSQLFAQRVHSARAAHGTPPSWASSILTSGMGGNAQAVTMNTVPHSLLHAACSLCHECSVLFSIVPVYTAPPAPLSYPLPPEGHQSPLHPGIIIHTASVRWSVGYAMNNLHSTLGVGGMWPNDSSPAPPHHHHGINTHGPKKCMIHGQSLACCWVPKAFLNTC